MKKNILILSMMMAFVLCACGGESSKKIEGEVKNNDEMVQEVESEEQAAEENTASYKGYAYMHDGVAIEIDAQADVIIEQLGEPLSYFEAPSCAFEGIDKIYTYSSFEVETYPLNEKDYVSLVTLKDDSVATTEGVSIGDTVDKVKEVYGSECTEESGMIIYKKDNMKLCFIIQEDTVASVEYVSTVLDE